MYRYRGEGRTLAAIERNFLNLSDSYERLFGEVYGSFEPNEKRIELLKWQKGTPPSEAYHIIHALHKTKNVEGDVCEFGVAQGNTSQIIANEILNIDKILHLFDSFEGLPAPTEKDELKDDIYDLGSIEAYKGTMSNPERLVLSKLSRLPFPGSRIRIHKGFIEELIEKKDSGFPTKVSFAYIDFDFYEPIKIALEYLDTVSAVGAVFVVDDYDFFSTGVEKAVKEFLENRGDRYELFVPEKVHGAFAVLTKLG